MNLACPALPFPLLILCLRCSCIFLKCCDILKEISFFVVHFTRTEPTRQPEGCCRVMPAAPLQHGGRAEEGTTRGKAAGMAPQATGGGAPGQSFDQFEYVSSLGEGAYGQVWLCKVSVIPWKNPR